MTKEEKEEFFQTMKIIIIETVDIAVNKAVTNAVNKAVAKEVDIAVKNTITKSVNIEIKNTLTESISNLIDNKIEKAIAPLRQDINYLKQEIKNFNQEMIELKDMMIPSIQNEIRKISRAITVIEVEHGKKLDILFEAYTINLDNIEKSKRKIHFCEKKIKQHDGEIYYLKSNLNKV